ncbi:sigma-70 family RNA polymerase sigma factor [Lampropedia puyangensis]|uniref:Sigma-70 family RNA polymerase sigma factor n=1 Tax=Lampropedia puyangensis TaxID=1330072 RepID=A0A4S8EZ46_9BURK|nr:sigma-70 family RNA polymerase sigma factor [Lampropedia puyangensis]THT99896.1 sigma-70 family RNA polymerase sigma factor [Lampropedia puyangensis]
MNSPYEETDDALMQAYAGGHQASFNTLYARHEKGLLRFIARTLGRTHQQHAEEVFQDTWLRLIQARNSYTPQGAQWRTWAFTIAHNAAMDCLRRAQRSPQLVDTPHTHAEDKEWGLAPDEAALRISYEALQVGHADSAEEQAYWRAAGRRLLNCLEELTPEQRAAFILKHEEDRPMDELAQQLGIAFEALRSRLRYGTQKLKQCMGSYLQALEAGQ